MKRPLKLSLALVLISAVAAATLIYGRASRSVQPNVVLIVVDTLAFRHLRPYASDGAAIPNLQKLSERGIQFTKAVSPSPWTKPAVASLFTGDYPSKHGVLALNDRLAGDRVTLAEWLKDSGYRTKGIVSHTLIDGPSGYDQGFESYETVKFRGNIHDAITSDQVTDIATAWLRSYKDTSPDKSFFLFLHYFDPHYNYQHHPQFNRTAGYSGPIEPGLGIRKLRQLMPTLTSVDIEYMKNLYREEITYTDFHIGRLLDFLQSSIPEDTIVIVTADHGEEFMEHGFIGHTRTLYDELVHVPLIISYPNRFKPSKVDVPVSTVDIAATLQELLGKSDTASSGLSLVPYLKGAPDPQPNRSIFAEVDFESSHIKANKVGIIQNTRKIVHNRENDTYEYLDLEKDPFEKSPIPPDTKVELTNQMLEELKEFARDYKRKETNQIKRDAKEVEQLKSLGYIQ